MKPLRSLAQKCRALSELQRGHLLPGARIEPVAPGVAEEIEGQDGEHHRQGGEDDHVGGVEEMAAGVIEHGAPTGNWSENAEAEETERASRVDRAVALRYE